MYPDPIDERIAKAISESRRLIEETKRLLQESSETLVPLYTDPKPDRPHNQIGF